jgi:hypothetical protein
MQVLLDALDRVKILQILPPEGNIVTLRVTRDLAKKVGFTAEEHKEFEIQEKDGMVKWNEKAMILKPFELADVEFGLIKTKLDDRDSKGTLTPDMVPLYEKFHP